MKDLNLVADFKKYESCKVNVLLPSISKPKLGVGPFGCKTGPAEWNSNILNK